MTLLSMYSAKFALCMMSCEHSATRLQGGGVPPPLVPLCTDMKEDTMPCPHLAHHELQSVLLA